MKELITNLKTNPLFQLSLGSKELFHSNFIAWILEYTENIDCKEKEIYRKHLLSKILNKEVTEVVKSPSREKLNIDLQITVKTKDNEEILIVIENKVKSMAYSEQLKNYSDKIKNKNKDKNAVFYLLSLAEPIKEVKDLEKWNLLRYDELAGYMGSGLYLFKDSNCNFNTLLSEYIKFIEQLHKVAEYIEIKADDEKFDYFDSEIRKSFEAIRIHDFFIKYKHEQITYKIDKRINDEFNLTKVFPRRKINKKYVNPDKIKNGYNLESGYSNNDGMIDFKYIIKTYHINKDKSPSYYVVGIQLQGKELRFVLELISNDISTKTKQEAKKIIIKLSDELRKSGEGIWLVSAKNIVENSNAVEPKLLGKGRKKEFKDLCSFGDTMVYKYNLISDTATVNEIVDLFIDLIKYIRKNVGYFEKEINKLIK